MNITRRDVLAALEQGPTSAVTRKGTIPLCGATQTTGSFALGKTEAGRVHMIRYTSILDLIPTQAEVPA